MKRHHLVRAALREAAAIARLHGRLAVGIEAMALAEYVATDIEAAARGDFFNNMAAKDNPARSGLAGPLHAPKED